MFLSVEEFIRIKTQPCNEQTCKYSMRNLQKNKIKAEFTVWKQDKYMLNCFGYHSLEDKRRPIFSNQKQTNINTLNYQGTYYVDRNDALNPQNKPKKQSQTTKNKNQCLKKLKNSCNNFVEYLFHPLNYKTIPCPFIIGNKQKKCQYHFCPFKHQYGIIDEALKKILQKYRTEYQSQSQIHNQLGKQFKQKILNVVLVRSAKSLSDLEQKQSRALNKSQQKVQISGSPLLPTNRDIKTIQQMKEKFLSQAQKYLKIQKQKHLQQQSRQIPNQTQLLPANTSQVTSQTHPNKQMKQLASFQYFKYGEQLSIVQGRNIEFKHYRDINDPNHIPVIMKYIGAFLNSEGGKFYIGIDDNSYVYGTKCTQNDYDRLLCNIDREGKFNMNPPLMPQKYAINRIPVYHDRRGQERWVIQITVFATPSHLKKLFLYNRQCYMRMNASTHKLNAMDIIQYLSLNSQSSQQHNHQTPVDSIGMRLVQEKYQVKDEKQVSKKTYIETYSSLGRKGQFKTEQVRQQQFERNIENKSLQELYLLRKQYQEKLNKITQIYRKKQRQMR